MRSLGIDPGTHSMGVGAIDTDGSAMIFVNADVLRANRTAPQAQRLHRLYTLLVEYIAKIAPDEIAIEEPFVGRNVKSALSVGRAQAVAMIAAAASDIPVQTYAPREVKLAATGFGNSSKSQVQEMVLLALQASTQPMSQDASDALAVSFCHINARRAQALTQEART